MKKTLALLLMLMLCLTGCSSANIGTNNNITIKWENGVMSYKGTTIPCTEYNGYSGTAIGSDGNTWNLFLDPAKDFTSITTNTQMVMEENMDSYKGYKYYVEYLNTQMTFAGTADESYKKVAMTTNTAGITADMSKVAAANILDAVPMTNGIINVDFGPFVFGTEYDVVTVRTDCALIPGVIKVSQGTYETTSTASIVQGKKEFQIPYGSSQNYDYYVYEGYLIQIVKGMDISYYIKFD